MAVGAAIMAIICLLYWLILIAYSGFSVAQSYIWLFIAFFFFFLSYISRLYSDNPKRVPLSFIVPLHVLTILAIIIVAVLQLLIFSTSGKPAPRNIDYLIVLGCKVHADGHPSKSLKYRLDRAIQYLDENPSCTLVLSGGKGSDEPISEAEAMAAYLVYNGVPENKIYLEKESKSTRENIVYSKALISKRLEQKRDDTRLKSTVVSGPVLIAEEKPYKIGIITNGFHMFRAISMAQSMGFEEIYPVSAKSDTLTYVHYTFRECLAILKDKFMGYI